LPTIPPFARDFAICPAILTSPFDAKETLFYKSVKRVLALFAFLPDGAR
jgi:hypothetical protein